MNQTAWERRGLQLAKAYHGNQWAFGQWWHDGKGWSRARTAFVASAAWRGPSAARLRTIGYVCRRVKPSFRKEGLSFTHHEAVAALPPRIAINFLEQAIEHDWRVEALKAHVASYRQSHQPANINTITLAPPRRRYTALLIDPPWQFDNPIVNNRIQRHYQTLTDDEIKRIPVDEMVVRDGYVFLWVPNPLLDRGIDALRAWGLTYVANLCWIKTTKRLGVGNHWRNAHELLLLGLRGDAPAFLDKTLLSYIEAPPGAHSAKPDAVRTMIEKAVPGPYAEAFARSRRPGWDVILSPDLDLVFDAAD